MRSCSSTSLAPIADADMSTAFATATQANTDRIERVGDEQTILKPRQAGHKGAPRNVPGGLLDDTATLCDIEFTLAEVHQTGLKTIVNK